MAQYKPQWKKYIEYLKNWAEEHKDDSFEGMTPASYDEWEENEDCADHPNREIICKIVWRKQDIVDAFRGEYGREPSADEVEAIYDCYKAEECEDGSIGYGWSYIEDAIEEAVPVYDEDEEDTEKDDD